MSLWQLDRHLEKVNCLLAIYPCFAEVQGAKIGEEWLE
jgi:hypothetical protein